MAEKVIAEICTLHIVTFFHYYFHVVYSPI